MYINHVQDEDEFGYTPHTMHRRHESTGPLDPSYLLAELHMSASGKKVEPHEMREIMFKSRTSQNQE